jgi:energy-coupling factor transporter ATP-binding protein EcfA2
MYLKCLKLKNFRCFAEAELDLDLLGGENRKWTVLVGENGTGKSTILQAAALVMSGAEALGELIGDVDSWIKNGADQAEISAEIETASGAHRAISLRIERGENVEALQARSLETASDLNDALAHTSRNYLALGYGTSRRPAGPSSEAQHSEERYKHPRARSLVSLFDSDACFRPMEDWLLGLGEGEQKDTLGIVKELAEEFLPEISFQIDEDQKSVLCETKDDGIIPMQYLGGGYQNLISLIGDLLYQVTSIFQDYRDPLMARGLLMIDNIESQLHPKLQRRLLDFLERRLPSMQLVVSTQSLVVAQQSPLEALHYAIKRPDGLELTQFGGDPRLMRLNQLMMTEAFGDSTYESLEIEQMKREYRDLHAKADRSEEDAEKMAEIADTLGHSPKDPEGYYFDPEHIQLLAEVKAALATDRTTEES